MSNPRLTQIAQARDALRERQKSVPLAFSDRGWVWHSWHRCLERGAEPGHEVEFNAFTAPHARRVSDRHRDFVAVARPILHELAKSIAPLNYFVLLTDADGTVIHTAGVQTHGDADVKTLARIGLDLSEKSVGTTAISGALSELAPVWLHRGEHFFSNASIYSCAGAPVWGPQGRCMGTIDVTGVRSTERPELLHLVAQYAAQLENALVLAQAHQLLLRLRWSAAGPGTAGEGLLCANQEGVIVGANRTAHNMLPLLQQDAGQTHLSDVFALPWTTLFDMARTGRGQEVPLWSGLRVWVDTGRTADGSHPAVQTVVSAARAVKVPTLKAVEAELVRQAVREAGGRVDVAARALGISRATVYRRLRSARAPAKKKPAGKS